MFWVLLIIACPLLFYFVFIKPFKYWKNKGVPQLDVSSIWAGLYKGFLQKRSMAEGFQSLYNSFPNSRYAGIYQFFKPTLLLRDPEIIKQITVKDFDHFVDHNQIFLEGSEPLWEKNLFSLKGEQWKGMRSTLSPTFTSSKMKAMFGLMRECAQEFVAHFKDQGPETKTVEMKDIFGKFANDVIASIAFGVKCDSLNNPEDEFYLMGKKATNFVGFRLILLFIAPKFAKILGIKLFSDTVRTFFKNLVVDNMAIREKEKIIRPDMMHLLMEARKGKLKSEKHGEASETGFAVVQETSSKETKVLKHLSDDDITAQVFGFFLAGFETVTAAMSFLAYELAVNPEVQTRLQSEVDRTFSDCHGTLTYDALVGMKYLDMVVSESLRKWPPASAADRICVKPCTIGKDQEEVAVQLNKGDILLIPIFGIHRDPLHYPEPERFDPERFSEENRSKILPYTYLTFGIGPRSCIGSRFALMEIKVAIFYILRHFEIEVVEKTPIPLVLGKNPFTLSAKDGFWLGLKRRDL